MKKLTFAALPALLMVCQHNICFSQITKVAGNAKATSPQSIGNRTTDFGISNRVLASFTAAFAGITDESWCPSDHGFMARFVRDSIQHFAYFTTKGRLESIIRYYRENDLPPAVSTQIKEAYRPVSIGSVKEVTCGGTTAYLVTIDFGSSWQIIRYVNGEMDVWESHEKG